MIEWNDIPAAERFDLLATIREMREWRYGGVEPLRPLQPIRQAALALYEFRVRSGERTGGERVGPQSGLAVNDSKGNIPQPSRRRAIRGQGELLTVDRQRSEPWEGSARSISWRPSHPKTQGDFFNDASAN